MAPQPRSDEDILEKLKRELDLYVDGLQMQWEQYKYVWLAWAENQTEETLEALDKAKREIARTRRRVFDLSRRISGWGHRGRGDSP